MRRFSKTPIRRKLTLIIMVTALAALLLAGLGIVTSDSYLYRSYLERDISALITIVANNSTAALAFEDSRSAAEILASLRARPHIVNACLYRPDGTVLAQYSRSSGVAHCPPTDSADGIRFVAGEVTAAQPVVLGTRQVGRLTLLYDLGEVDERRRLFGNVVLVVVLAAGLIAYFVSSELQGTISIPISRLAETTLNVSRTRDFGLRAEKHSEDELGILVDAFNEMLAGIQFRDRELVGALRSREDALRDARTAHDSMETTLASIGDAVISTDVRGRIFFANTSALRMMGLAESGVKGEMLDEVFRPVHEFTGALLSGPVTEVVSTGQAANMPPHTLLIAKDGKKTPIDASIAPIRRLDGPIEGTVLVFRDMTARRRAEQTSRLLASIVESSGDAIIAQSLDGIVTSWNRGAEAIFGYTPQEMIGRPVSVLAASGRESEMHDMLERIDRGERIEQFQTVQLTKSGKPITVSLTISPVHDGSGRIIGASKIARDITENVQASERLARLNADLRKSNDNLSRSNEDLERFAFAASHDLQEPLRMITIYSQLLVQKCQPKLDAETNTFLENIVAGTQRMRQLLADLLAYTEVSSRAEESPEVVDLDGVMAIVRQNLKALLEESRATLTIDLLPVIRANRAHFVSLLQNLIENAIKYRSSADPQIRVSLSGQGDYIQFAVADNGVGIEPEYFDRIFVPFKRLHGKEIPGTGIGLAICQRVVERYGGRIWVESEPGRGSTMFFTVPRARVSEKEV